MEDFRSWTLHLVEAEADSFNIVPELLFDERNLKHRNISNNHQLLLWSVPEPRSRNFGTVHL